MYLLIIFLPLINLIFAGIFGRFLGKKYISIFIIFNMFFCFLISFFCFYEVGIYRYTCFIELMNWINIGLLKIKWIFLFDTITSSMILLVIFVSFLVHVYSLDYMSEDPHLIRFLGYLSLFTFFMLMLITSGTLIQLFLGWEGVGLSSYLLINFWYTRIQANKSAMKAIIVNRVGDFGIYFALLLIFYFFKSLDFSVIFNLSYFFTLDNVNLLFININKLDLICLFLFLGVVGKSAQLGLHTWLPDAMEGPTPVSALIHAATMVTAGVFVLIRCSPLFEYCPIVLFHVCLFGALTAFFAGTIGMVQYDLKKVIAYSTCSQLGYMVFISGMSNYNVSLFHLFNHGFFKALLFLGAGSIIHALNDEQDMRKMGGLVKILPLTYIAIVIGSLSLMGFPFLTGFYSKDMILELVFVKYNVHRLFIYWLGVMAACLTSFYSIRLIYLVFFVKTNSSIWRIKHSHESNSFIFIVLFILSFFSIFIGFLFKDLFVGFGTDFWNNSIFNLYQNNDIVSAEFLNYYFKLIPLFFSFFGFLFSLLLYMTYYKLSFIVFKNKILLNIYWFLMKKWYFDLFYNNIIVFNLFSFFYNITFKLIDRGIIEVFGPLSLVRSLNYLSMKFSIIQTGYLYHYIFITLLGIIFIIFFIFTNINIFFIFNININLLICCCLSIIFYLSLNTNNNKI